MAKTYRGAREERQNSDERKLEASMMAWYAKRQKERATQRFEDELETLLENNE